MGEVIVLAINREQRIACRADNVIGDFVDFLDDEGDETDDEGEAAFVLVEWRTGGFTPLRLADYDFGRPH